MLRRRRLLSTLFSTTPTPTPTTTTSPSPKPNPNHRSPHTKTLNETINDLFNERSLPKLVSLFKSSSSSYRFRCRHKIYSSAVARLAAAKRPSAVEEIIEHQKQFREDFRTEGFGVRLISLYGKAGMADQAERMFGDLPGLGSPRTVKSFNALLTAFADCGEFERLEAACRRLQDAEGDIRMNGISYNILIKSLCSRGKLDEAFETLDIMEKNGIPPCLVSYNTLLNAFYGNNRFSDAENIWDRMKKENIKPDTMSFNTKLRGLVSAGKTLEAADLVGELKIHGLKPDTHSFTALIKGYLTDGNIEEAKKVYMDLTQNDCAPNKGTFAVMLPKLCDAGELDFALKLCNESMSRKRYADAEVVQRVVDELVKASRVEEAEKLVELGRANEFPKKKLKMPIQLQS
ncbi:pentatricopeptide repeat-containing protein-like, mitochondrial [Iris pallida]|uniref:Pentatricopeptide repeat-containing protein-like, mitochondrial n=1 Tax=Iris pallida TaxID=29817 RepID=A0AAX6EYB6_IRIPA|nr:pentatricopeptide repeat-containing protein-like, mitochondrial [Iris pallida]